MTNISGQYRDKLIDGRGRILLDRGWRKNLIVRDCDRLIACLMKGRGETSGISFLALGEGLTLWDSLNPHPEPTATHLTREILRLPLTTEEIHFLDGNNQATDIPTGALGITLEIKGEDIAPDGLRSIREFGLFGGDATPEHDSGMMINHVIHPRIDITTGLTLVRTLRLYFSSGFAVRDSAAGSFGANLPVTVIDGVGVRYAEALNAAGVQTIQALSGLDPLTPLGNISIARIREFRAKAKLIMGVRVNPAQLTGLMDYRVRDLLRQRPDELAEIAASEQVTAQTVAELQEGLAILTVVMDETKLKEISLNELLLLNV